MVQLKASSPRDINAEELFGSLRDKYGKPNEERQTRYSTNAKWRTGTDRINYFATILPKSSYLIAYEPRETANNENR